MPLPDLEYRILRLVIENSDLSLDEDNRLETLALSLSVSIDAALTGISGLIKKSLITMMPSQFYVVTPTGMIRLTQD